MREISILLQGSGRAKIRSKIHRKPVKKGIMKEKDELIEQNEMKTEMSTDHTYSKSSSARAY